MKYLLTGISLMLVFSAQAQKWQPGHFTDLKGNVVFGTMRVNPNSRPVIPDEGFIEFKEDEKSPPFKVSANDLRSFVMGRDSFIVAHAPKNEVWTGRQLDFVRVVLNEDVKLYAARL